MKSTIVEVQRAASRIWIDILQVALPLQNLNWMESEGKKYSLKKPECSILNAEEYATLILHIFQCL